MDCCSTAKVSPSILPNRWTLKVIVLGEICHPRADARSRWWGLILSLSIWQAGWSSSQDWSNDFNTWNSFLIENASDCKSTLDTDDLSMHATLSFEHPPFGYTLLSRGLLTDRKGIISYRRSNYCAIAFSQTSQYGEWFASENVVSSTPTESDFLPVSLTSDRSNWPRVVKVVSEMYVKICLE